MGLYEEHKDFFDGYIGYMFDDLELAKEFFKRYIEEMSPMHNANYLAESCFSSAKGGYPTAHMHFIDGTRVFSSYPIKENNIPFKIYKHICD